MNEFNAVTDNWAHGDVLCLHHRKTNNVWNLQIKRTTNNRVRIHDQRWLNFKGIFHLSVGDMLVFTSKNDDWLNFSFKFISDRVIDFMI